MNTLASVLHKLLANNIVSFTFEKVDGTIRHAIGTRNLSMAENYTGTTIPTPKGEEQPNSYYDVEKMGWRSYKPENLIGIDGFVPCAPFEKKDIYTLGGEELKKEIDERKAETDNAPIDLDDIMRGFGKMPMGETKKAWKELDEDIDLVPKMPMKGSFVLPPCEIGKEHTALPLGGMLVEDFAKLVAHYVVLELVEKLTK